MRFERGKVDRARYYGRCQHACRLVQGFRERGRTRERLFPFRVSARKQSAKVYFGAIKQAGERQLALQTANGELHDLDPVRPQPDAPDPADRAGFRAELRVR